MKTIQNKVILPSMRVNKFNLNALEPFKMCLVFQMMFQNLSDGDMTNFVNAEREDLVHWLQNHITIQDVNAAEVMV